MTHDQYGLPADWTKTAQHWQFSMGLDSPFEAHVSHNITSCQWVEVHQPMELGVVLSGHSHWCYVDYELTVGPGEVWLNERWEPHGIRMEEPTERVVLVFLPEFLGTERQTGVRWRRIFSAPPPMRPWVTDETTRAEVLALGQVMRREILEKRTGWEAAVRLQTLLLLLVLRRAWSPGGRAAEPLPETGLRRIMPALELAQTDPSRPIHLREAAAACALSVSQFCRVFRGAMRMSFRHFDLHTRVGLAGALLEKSDLSTQAIAERTGFVDAAHLYRVFKAVYSVSPSGYRAWRRAER